MNPNNPVSMANAQSVDPHLPNFVATPQPNIAMSAPSSLPQTNQGGQRPTYQAGMAYQIPAYPASLYITPMQKDQILMILRMQGLVPAGAQVVNDSYGLGLPPTMGDGVFYSLYWKERVTVDGQGFDQQRSDNLGATYHNYMDKAIAAQRAGDHPPIMERRGDDGSIGFRSAD